VDGCAIWSLSKAVNMYYALANEGYEGVNLGVALKRLCSSVRYASKTGNEIDVLVSKEILTWIQQREFNIIKRLCKSAW
jgi:hypothetical protein